MGKSTTTTGEYCEHVILAIRWLHWNGKKGTELQAAKIMRQLSLAQLRQMLAARGVEVR